MVGTGRLSPRLHFRHSGIRPSVRDIPMTCPAPTLEG